MAGWEQKPLSEICGFQRGLTYAKSDEVDGPGHTVLRANNINLASHELDFNDLKFISDSVDVPTSKVVRPGSLLVCTASGSKSHLGKVAYIDSEYGYAFGGFMGQLTPFECVDGRYLFYVLISPGYKDFIEALSDGVNINNLKFDDLGHFPVPFPPLPEQRRIVAILDEAFEGIAQVRANAEMCVSAVSTLFESFLESVFDEASEGLNVVQLGAATGGVFTGPFGSLLHKSDYVFNGIPLVNPSHITESGIEPDQNKSVSIDTAKRLASYVMRKGDIVIARRGEMGRCALITEKEDGWLCGTGSFVIRPSKICNPRFLVRLLRSAKYKSKLESIAGGAVMPNLSNTDLSNLCIVLPTIDKQLEKLDQIDEMAKRCRALRDLYQRKLVALENLKKALLAEAFAGKLSPILADWRKK